MWLEKRWISIRVLDSRLRVVGLSLIRGTALYLWARHFIVCLVLGQPRKTCPDNGRHDWKIVDWDVKNQNKYKIMWLKLIWIHFFKNFFQNIRVWKQFGSWFQTRPEVLLGVMTDLGPNCLHLGLANSASRQNLLNLKSLYRWNLKAS